MRLFTTAVQSVRADKSFSLPSPANVKAIETASAFTTWFDCPESQATLRMFSLALCAQLHACFSSKHTSHHLKKERMWRSFHCFRTATTFRNDWRKFIEVSVSQQVHPAFFQHVTMMIFKKMIKVEFPLPPTDTTEHPDRPLTFEEKNALRFVAGYVCRKVRTSLERSSIAGKNEMVFCVMSFAGDEEDGDTEVWLNAVDRGELWDVNDMTFTLFLILEEEIRQFFTTYHFNWFRSEANPKQKIVEHLQQNGNIPFQWSLLTTSLQEVASSLLKRILYVTVRGFGFASSCIEMFKQTTQQSLQRKKALRKHIQL